MDRCAKMRLPIYAHGFITWIHMHTFLSPYLQKEFSVILFSDNLLSSKLFSKYRKSLINIDTEFDL